VDTRRLFVVGGASISNTDNDVR